MYAANVIEAATPEIVAGAQTSAKGEIIAEIRKRTGLGPSIISGVVVWLVTIALALLVVFGAPEWVRSLVEHATPK